MRFAEVAKLRGDFIRIACSIGASRDEAEDIVQELMIQLLKIDRREGSLSRITKEGKLNMSYIFRAIINLKEKNSRWKKNIDQDAEYPIVRSKPISVLELDIRMKLDRMHYYYGMLYDAYLQDGSMRILSNGSKIALKTIWNDLRYIKTELRKHLNDETS